MSGSPNTQTVTVKIVGVRRERVPRLLTAIKTHIQRFGNHLEIDEGAPDEEVDGGKSTAQRKVQRPWKRKAKAGS